MAYSASANQLTYVLQRFYRRVGGVVTLATGGSTTTAIDTKLTENLQEGNVDDFLNGGTLIVIEDAGGAAAAPEGEFSRITDYVASTTTITVSPALTTSIASGDRILFAPSDFPLYDIIEVVNDALADLSLLPKYDTSITTAANQTEYTLPVAVKGGRIANVELQGITTDANDNRYIPLPNWEEWFAAAGTAGTFRLPQLASGYIVRITYYKKHPRVDAFDDYIDEFYDPELVYAAVMVHAIQWKNDNDRVAGSVSDGMAGLEQKAWQQYDRAKVEHRTPVVPRRFPSSVHWGTNVEEDEFTYPGPA